MMGFNYVIWVALGGALGAVLRWMIGLSLNHLSPHIIVGTLAANLLGAFIMGLCIALVEKAMPLPGQWQLFIMTGFLGALTTFSTFTAESFTLLHQSDYFYFILHLLLHLVGSLLCFSLGWLLLKFLLPS